MDWRQWYKIFETLVELYFPDKEKIQEGVNTLHNWFSQDQSFMSAYKKWMEEE